MASCHLQNNWTRMISRIGQTYLRCAWRSLRSMNVARVRHKHGAQAHDNRSVKNMVGGAKGRCQDLWAKNNGCCVSSMVLTRGYGDVRLLCVHDRIFGRSTSSARLLFFVMLLQSKARSALRLPCGVGQTCVFAWVCKLPRSA